MYVKISFITFLYILESKQMHIYIITVFSTLSSTIAYIFVTGNVIVSMSLCFCRAMCVWVDEEPLAFFQLGPYDGHPFKAKNREGSAGRANLIEDCDYDERLM